MIRIPLAQPDLTGKEREYVNAAIDSTWIASTGEFLETFESEFAERCGTRHAVAVANGTVALHLALLALGIGPGDEVIVPSLTYIASVNAITYVRATPVFVDVDPISWCVDVDAVKRAVTHRTRAILAVHLYGQPADMSALRDLSQQHGIRLVEDAAEALLAKYQGRTTGSLGDIATFSFYGNKILTSGEGGAVTLDDDALAARVRLLRGQGMDLSRRYFFPIIGYNYRLTNIAGAFLCAQLERADEIVARRKAIYARYDARFAHVPGLTLQPRLPDRELAPWLYSILVEPQFGRTRNEVMQGLADSGVETRPFFIPVHTLPPYADQENTVSLPHTNRLAASGINLPTFTQMTDLDVDDVCDALLGLRLE
jgi:perosamine synthetase